MLRVSIDVLLNGSQRFLANRLGFAICTCCTGCLKYRLTFVPNLTNKENAKECIRVRRIGVCCRDLPPHPPIPDAHFVDFCELQELLNHTTTTHQWTNATQTKLFLLVQRKRMHVNTDEAKSKSSEAQVKSSVVRAEENVL